MTARIKLSDVFLRFRVYGSCSDSIKDLITQRLIKGRLTRDLVEFWALKEINVDIRRGETVGLIGLNGAGKSTLLKCIAGIYVPQYGRIDIEGTVTPLIEFGTGFDIELTGRENVELNWLLRGRSKEMLKTTFQSIVEFSELEEFIDMPVKYYSSGMAARLAFAIATAVKPEIWL